MVIHNLDRPGKEELNVCYHVWGKGKFGSFATAFYAFHGFYSHLRFFPLLFFHFLIAHVLSWDITNLPGCFDSRWLIEQTPHGCSNPAVSLVSCFGDQPWNCVSYCLAIRRFLSCGPELGTSMDNILDSTRLRCRYDTN